MKVRWFLTAAALLVPLLSWAAASPALASHETRFQGSAGWELDPLTIAWTVVGALLGFALVVGAAVLWERREETAQRARERLDKDGTGAVRG